MNPTTHLLCVDIDNVIAQTDTVMRQVIQDYTEGRVKLAYEDVQHFNYYECTDANRNGISKEEWSAIHDMFSEPSYISTIKPMPEAIEQLQYLAKRVELHIATSRLRKARQATIEWLDKAGLPNHDLHFVKHNAKHTSLGSLFAAFEDHYDQAIRFAAKGTTCFLLRHPWNAGKPTADRIHWVDTWPELTEGLLSLIPAA